MHCNYVCVLLGEGTKTKHVLIRLQKPLREMIDPDFMLTADLMHYKLLTDEDRQKVERKFTYQERNDVLLKSVCKKNDVSLAALQFGGCLLDSHQDHVYNFILYDGGKQTFLSCLF